MHDNPTTNRSWLLLLLPLALAAGTVATSCKDDDCSKLENIKWTCASRYCQAGGAGSALCFCWQHDMALGSWTAGSCADFKDNDEDGFTDCDDVDCRRSEACNCDNGEDDDGNGAVDCDDIQCANSAHCCGLAERAPLCCHDGIDNDEDGLTDCESDPDCALACCNDGTDNDGDGLTDCDDPDCSGDVACLPESVCHDGVDDDLDGWTDCADVDCVGNPACQGDDCVADRDLGLLPVGQPVYVTGSTDGLSDRYRATCNPWSGPDRVFSFELDRSGVVTLRLSQAMTSDHGLVLAFEGGPGSACVDWPHICAASSGPGLPVVVRSDILPAGRYQVLVDAWGEQGAGAFSLQVTSEEQPQ